MKRTTRLPWLTLVLAMGILIPGAASGSADLGFDGVGLEARFVEPNAGDGTVGVGALVDLGGFTPNVRLEARTDYWSNSESIVGGKASARDIAVGARSKYVFPLSNPSIRPFAGAGLGIHFMHAEVSVAEQNIGGLIIPAMQVEDSATRLGLDIGGGMNYSINAAASLLSELWFTMVDGGADMSLGLGVVWHLGSAKQMQAK